MSKQNDYDGPLNDLAEWEDDVLRRYPNADGAEKDFVATDPKKKKSEFRDYGAQARPSVKEFYRLNHRFQTYDFVQQKREEYLPLRKKRMGAWEAMEFLNTLVDDSDPDMNPDEALYMIRYHSFYAAHRERQYDYLMDDRDREMFRWVRKFNPYHLYTNSHERPDASRLPPYYEQLIGEYLPAELNW